MTRPDSDLNRRLDDLTHRLETIERLLNVRANDACESADPGSGSTAARSGAPTSPPTPPAALPPLQQPASTGDDPAPMPLLPVTPGVPAANPAPPVVSRRQAADSTAPTSPPTEPSTKPSTGLSTEPSTRPATRPATEPLTADPTAAAGNPQQAAKTSTTSEPAATREPVTRDLARAALARRTETSPPPARPEINIERLVGGRIFAVAGALVVVAGAALFLKFAWDQGWLNQIPDAFKCGTAALFGFVLLATGEIARRKLGAWASIGCSAAGIGVLYATAFATYGFFELVPPHFGFLLLIATTVIGILVGLRGGLASIAALSLIAGYLSPLLFLDIEWPAAVLPSYLFSLLVLGLTVCFLRGHRYAVLRSISWWGTIGFGTAWIGGHYAAHPWLTLVFLAATWATIHAELILSGRRSQLTALDESAGPSIPEQRPDREPALAAGRKRPADTWRVMRPLASSFSSTAWAVVLAAVTLGGFSTLEWLSPAAGFAVMSMMALALGGHLRVLRDRPRNDVERLAAVFAVQAGALLIAAVAMSLAGWLEVTGWLALGVAAVVAGRWLPSRALDVYGLIVLAIATTRLVLLEWWTTGVAATGFTIFGFYLTRFTVLVVCAAIAWIAAAFLLRRPDERGRLWGCLRNAAIGLGTTLAFGSLLHQNTSNTSAVFVIIALAATIHIIVRFTRSAGLLAYTLLLHAGAILAVVAHQWWLPHHTTLAAPFGTVVTNWTPLVWLTATAWLGLSVTLAGWVRPDEPLQRVTLSRAWNGPACTAIAIGATLAFAALLHLNTARISGICLVIGLAVTSQIAGRIFRSTGLFAYSLAVHTVAVAALALQQWWLPSHPATFAPFGVILTKWTPIVWLAAAGWFTFARTLTRSHNPGWAHVVHVATAAGQILLYVSLINLATPWLLIAAAWLGLSGVLFAVAPIFPRLALRPAALLGTLACLLPWTLGARPFAWNEAITPLLLHPGLWLAVAIAVTLTMMATIARKGHEPGSFVAELATTAVGIAVALIFATTSLEVARIATPLTDEQSAQRAAVSIWWGIFAVIMLATGLLRHRPIVRRFGLGLLAVATLKAVLFDLVGVPAGWRVASFLTLGVLMLGVGIVYARLTAPPAADKLETELP